LKGKWRIRFVTRNGLIRLGVLGGLLAVFSVWGYFSMIRMPGRSYSGPLPALTEEEAGLRDRLRRQVEKLAGEIGERTVFLPEKLAAAADWIESELGTMGYPVTRQEYQSQRVACRILAAELPGGALRQEVIVVGAHYDSVMGCPGANDNGTGVAGLLEIARGLRGRSFPRTVRFVAFPNEEPPFFQTEAMGSLVYARACRARGEGIAAMLSLETMGYYRDEPKSQSYPAPMSLFYPDRGNFIGFVGNHGSRALVRDCVRRFRETTQFPSEGGAVFAVLPGVGWSDHWSFWQAGYPALMVTDTAPFRYPYYHTQDDTPEKVDYDRLARVVAGLARVVAGLAGE
jgi:hypothetical protein